MKRKTLLLNWIGSSRPRKEAILGTTTPKQEDVNGSASVAVEISTDSPARCNANKYVSDTDKEKNEKIQDYKSFLIVGVSIIKIYNKRNSGTHL